MEVKKGNGKPLVVMLDFVKEITLEEKILTCEICNFECWSLASNEYLPLDRLGDVFGVLVWHTIDLTDAKLISLFKNCKIIVRVGMGFDSVNLKACGDQGIYVCNIPDYGVEEVADSALCFILNLMRKTFFVANLLHHTQTDFDSATLKAKGATRLRGRKLGIIGLGKIGTAVAVRAKAFGFKVYFYDPFIPDGIEKSIGIKRVDSLKDLMQTCNVISVNCHLNESSKYIIGKESLSFLNKVDRSKGEKGVYIVNTARGKCLDTEALVEALRDGRVEAFALDVLENEPEIPECLRKVMQDNKEEGGGGLAERVIVTPHTAFYSDDGFVEMRTKAAQEVKRVLENKAPRNCVNKEYLKKIK